jgi:hypothetical protein
VYALNHQYKYAEKLVGPLARDLVHHTVVRLHDKNVDWSRVKYPDTYFRRVMVQELHERGDFWKLYGTGERLPDQLIQKDDEDKERVCVDLCKGILSDMIREGYAQEVDVFRRSLHGSTYDTIMRDLRISRRSVAASLSFVKNELRHRYGTIDN